MAREVENEPTKSLVSGLLASVKDLASGELGRARIEIKDELGGLKAYMLRVAIAVGVGVLGAVLLAHTIALILAAIGVPMWLSYALASAMMIGTGAVILKRLPKGTKDIDLYPEESVGKIQADLRQVAHAARH